MAEMFPPTTVRRGPTDVALVVEVTLPQISSWLMHHFESLPEHLLQHIRDLDLLKTTLAPIYDDMRADDRLWLCRSREVGPLHGHEGVALVRDGRPIVYIRFVQY